MGRRLAGLAAVFVAVAQLVGAQVPDILDPPILIFCGTPGNPQVVPALIGSGGLVDCDGDTTADVAIFLENADPTVAFFEARSFAVEVVKVNPAFNPSHPQVMGVAFDDHAVGFRGMPRPLEALWATELNPNRISVAFPSGSRPPLQYFTQ